MSKPLTEKDAIDIWIARWLRLPRQELRRRYQCDPRRIYDIWMERRFVGSRAKALEEFRARFPALIDRIDPSPHRPLPRAGAGDAQMALFE